LLKSQPLVIAPGAYDCITARMIERANFPAVYMSGAGTAATLGYPDYGLITMSEMAENAGRIAAAVAVPVIADADTAYGNELNTVRTVREYEKLGVAGVHIEDQSFPKRCGHLEDKQIIPIEDFLAKIRAAVMTRRDPDFFIIARTDARSVQGFEEAVGRANASLEVGADMVFLEAPQTTEEVAAIPRLVKGPCLLNMVWRGKTPDLSLKDVERMGFRFAIMPSILTRTVMGACDQVLEVLKQTGRHPSPPKDISLGESFARSGAVEWDRYREQFKSAGHAAQPSAPSNGRNR
jgi:2-methylisocitrate lyase-like PEP mutase family enzyme